MIGDLNSLYDLSFDPLDILNKLGKAVEHLNQIVIDLREETCKEIKALTKRIEELERNQRSDR